MVVAGFGVAVPVSSSLGLSLALAWWAFGFVVLCPRWHQFWVFPVRASWLLIVLMCRTVVPGALGSSRALPLELSFQPIWVCFGGGAGGAAGWLVPFAILSAIAFLLLLRPTPGDG
ncbi:hypothetical protein DVH24_024174 [Malus domestica]|uniref:Uncharacterized protein n=1 Tax=Malus domestica TaxID=3750 RepID=A0A498JG33_MALDO|nr:hypothetical protein DVH24_024174 [Malus domestica]